jgi:dihydroorotate dehydrogenase electron transfer subunit
MYQEDVLITRNNKLNPSFYHLAFKSKRLASKIACGQFVFIRISGQHIPLLRRPFSVAWVLGGEINIVYKVVGKGTQLLTTRSVGEVLNIMGPLGNGFSLQESKTILLVAGGIGIASLISLTKMCVRQNVYLFYGARTKEEFISDTFLHVPKNRIIYATENGSRGTKGFITKPLEDFLKTEKKSDLFMYTCGPLAMLRSVVPMARKYGVAGEANLEERMGCGVGACLGCATETAHGIKMVCKDGPVFSFNELGW